MANKLCLTSRINEQVKITYSIVKCQLFIQIISGFNELLVTYYYSHDGQSVQFIFDFYYPQQSVIYAIVHISIYYVHL